MSATAVSPGEHVPTADQRVVMYGVPWDHYEAQIAMRGDKSVPRISYLKGTLELMRPSRDHERLTAWIGRLLEIFAEEHELQVSPYGSWTLKHPAEAGAEPDECYILGENQDRDRPDLVIEVVWTSGGIDKLEIYRHLQITEVWFWIDDRVEVYARREVGFERVERSELLPGLDLGLLCSFLDRPFLEAKRGYRAALRGG